MLISKLGQDGSRLCHATTIKTCEFPKGQPHLNFSIFSPLVLKAVSPWTDL